MGGNAETIDSSVNGIINLTNNWGSLVTVIFLCLFIVAVIIALYVWRVAPLKEQRKLLEEEKRSKEVPPINEASQITNKISTIEGRLDSMEKIFKDKMDIIDIKLADVTFAMKAIDLSASNIKERVEELGRRTETIHNKLFDLKR